MTHRLLLLTLALALAACGRDITAPSWTVPAGATRFTPSVAQENALQSVRQCMAVNGGNPDAAFTVASVAWYAMRGTSFQMPNGLAYQGASGAGWIVVARDAVETAKLTQHELAHQLSHEAVPHSSPFWATCDLMFGIGTTFTIP